MRLKVKCRLIPNLTHFIRQQLDDDISQFGVADELLDEGIWNGPWCGLSEKNSVGGCVCEPTRGWISF